ncbi:MAG: Gfo/Idh/MocA family oxidoreductase [Sporomusaceae bacterium]|nr:Gfo/Idh/MocA family oxidoreductase [Sporomusaceae bacterium]
MGKINIALVGCGRIAHKHIEALLNNREELSLYAVCDVVSERAEAMAKAYKQGFAAAGLAEPDVKMTVNYKELVADAAVQAVAIATESGKHGAIALEFLDAGKHALVEKPMALSTQEADAMIELAEAKGLALCVSHQNRFNPTVLKVRDALATGRFGRILAGNARILWNRNEDYYQQAPWRGTYEQDGGCLMNQCIHNIDLLQWMLGGEPQQVQAMLANFVHPYIEAEDYGSIQVRFASGAIGNVEGTVCVYPRNLEETLTLLGEKGTVVIGGEALNRVQVWQFADGLDSLEQVREECNNEIDSVYGRGHTPLYADWTHAMQTGEAPLVDGRQGKIAMSIILHAYEAQTLGRAVRFGDKALTAISYHK